MKWEHSQDEVRAAAAKKRPKRSTSFSKNLDIADDAADGTEDSAKPPKIAKRIKFEKPTKTKKLEKPLKSDAFLKTNKSKLPETLKKFPQKSQKSSTDGEKPDWIEFKKEKKELKEQRKAKRLPNVYEATVKAKMIGEKLRRADCSAEERVKLSQNLHDVLKGNYVKAIFAHDISRVIQWLVKYCSPSVRKEIVTEVSPSLVVMFQSKYAKNCVKKMLKHGDDEIRKLIISDCYGNIVKLVSHSVSAALLDYAYANFATDLNKQHFKQEFYGHMYRQSKDNDVKSISDVYATAKDMKSATLSAVKLNLARVLDKKLVGSPIAQAVLVDYLSICSPEDRAETIVALRSTIVELSRSDNGSKIARICIWHGTTKDRKFSLKAVKQEIKNLATSEHGHILLMAMFDSVDDTVLMRKLVIPEILSDLVEIASNEYGRRVILYLVARRDARYFHPALVEQLKQGDENATSKKAADVRENELIAATIEPFLDSIAESAESWLANSSIAIVTLAILKRGEGEKLRNAFEAIAGFIADPDSRIKEEKGEEISGIEHSGLHMMLKQLIVADKVLAATDRPTFGEALEKRLDVATVQRWINYNRGCFLLILLLENGVESVVASLKPKIKSLSSTLKSKKSPGASILLKKIK